jgi:hypothetical protein
VAAVKLISANELEFLRTLLDEGVEFMIVGLAAAALQGCSVVTQDIDLWFADRSADNFKRALKKVGVSYIAPSINNPPLLVGAKANLFDIVVHMHGLGTFEEENKNTLLIKLRGIRLPVLALKRIIASKMATNRPKDRAALLVLKEEIEVIEDEGG